MKFLKPIFKPVFALMAVCLLFAIADAALAGGAKDLSELSDHISGQVKTISKLLVMVAYVSGIGFLLVGMIQFKGHKDNPQQIPLSKPIIYVIVGAALLFLPTVMESAGQTLFEDSKESAGSWDGDV